MLLVRLAIVSLFLCVSVALDAPRAGAQACPGDCDDDHAVTVSEVVMGLDIALTDADVAACPNLDIDDDGRIAVNEPVAAVDSLLNGCPPTFTPTSTPTPTRTPTPTVTPTPTLTPTPTPSPTPTPTPPPPDLVVQINPDPVAPGETMLVSLTLSNRKTTPLTGGVIRALIPVNNVEAVTRLFIGSGGTCPSNSCVPGQTITWAVGTIPVGGARTVTFPLTVLSGASSPPNGTAITVNGMGSGDGTPTVNESATATVDDSPPLALSLDTDKDAVPPGGTLRYALTFGNRSVTLQAGAMLLLELPGGVSVQSISDGGVEGTGTVTWQLGDLPPGASGVREVEVRVDDAVSEGQSMPADATLTAGGDSASASVVTHVQSSAHLTLSIDTSPDPVAPGEFLVVAATVTNRGVTNLSSVAAEIRVPGQVSPFAPSFATGTVTCNTGATFNCDNFERAIWTIGELPAGHGVTLTFPVQVPSGQGAPASGSLIMFDAEVDAGDGSHAHAQRSVAVQANRPLELELDATPQPVGAGEELHYTLTFGNRSTGLASGATLALACPEGTTCESASGGGAIVDGVVTWALGDLAPGTSGTRELVVRVAAGADEGEPIRAEAALTAGSDEVRAHSVTQVESDVPITLNIAVSPDPVGPGEALAVSLTVTNRGPVSLFEVAAELRVPGEVVAFAPSFTNGEVRCAVGGTFNCDNHERALWTVGDLAPGQAATLSVPIVVSSGQNAPPAGAVISFEGRASANDGSAAETRRSVPVRTNRALELELDAAPEPVAAGEDLRYTLTFGNRSTGLVTGVTLAMDVPEGTSFQSVSDGGTIVDGRVTWSLGDLGPGAAGIRQLIVQVDGDAVQGTPILASATLAGASAEARAHAATPVEDDVPLTVNVAVGPDPVSPGEAMAISVMVTNRGPISLFEVAAAVRVPPEVSAFAPSFTNGSVTCNVGGTFNCDNLELAFWTVGELGPGQAAMLTIPAVVPTGQSAPAAGSLITWAAVVTANDGSQVSSRRTARVRPNRALELELDATTNPVEAEETLTYTVTFGNRGTSLVTDATLRLPLPSVTSFQGAPGGGIVVDGVVTWALGDLAPGASGVRQVLLDVDANAAEGTPISAQAILRAEDAEARADSLNRVETDAPLAVSVEVEPDPVMQGQNLLVSLTVANEGPVALFGVTARVRVPPEVTPFSAALTGGGTCNVGPTFGCDNLELVRYTIGTPAEGLAAGASVTLTMPPPVPSGASAPPDGTLITFEADATANGGRQAFARPSVRVE